MDAQQLKKWLNEQLESQPDKSKAELAKALNLEPPAISKILNGSRQIKAIEYVRILEFLGVSANQKGLPDLFIGNLSANNDQTNGLYEQNFKSDEWAIPQTLTPKKDKRFQKTPHHFCINDALMKPDLKEGEHVLIDGDTKPDEHPQAFLVSDGYNQMVRLCRVIPNSSPPTIEITAHSKEFEPQQLFQSDFDILGKVVAKINWL